MLLIVRAKYVMWVLKSLCDAVAGGNSRAETISSPTVQEHSEAVACKPPTQLISGHGVCVTGHPAANQDGYAPHAPHPYAGKCSWPRLLQVRHRQHRQSVDGGQGDAIGLQQW